MQKPLRQGEFVALMALLSATLAFSIDAMLPALPQIAQALSPGAPNKAQLVVTAFIFGMGLGTLFVGPLSDTFGRKPVMIWGAGFYILGAFACYHASSLDMLLMARVLQGLGAAAPRVICTAMVRDQYQGRAMARILSLVMMIFTLVPAIAPLLGQGIIHLAGWHAIFLVYIGFSLITMIWLILRQPETLAHPRPLSGVALMAAARELLRSRMVLLVTLTQSLVFASLFSTLSSLQGIFEHQFDRAASFPLWFGLIALASALGSVLNARVVMRLGMARVVSGAIASMFLLSIVVAIANFAGIFAFAMHILWSAAMFSLMGLSTGNLNAMAMEKVGHIAGMASSMITSVSTVVSVALAIPVGLAFNGTALPLYLGVAGFMAAALLILRALR